MNPAKQRVERGRRLFAAILSVSLLAAPVSVLGQGAAPAATRPAAGAVPPELAGRPVEEVRVLSRNRPLSPETSAEILRQVRTREGEAFAPATVEADYQRIYGLRRFSNVEARVEPTTTGGVIVVFEVTEPNVIKEIRFRGNQEIETKKLQDAINLRVGEAIDPFRLSLAREAIERLYQEKNFTYAHATVDQDELARTGVVVFNVVEGPRVRVRKVRILGNQSFTDSRIKDQTKTRAWFPLFVSGELDPEQLEQDVASIRQFYESHGFFDVRVGRKLVVSPNQKEVMVDFVIDEGRRYVVDKVSFRFVGERTSSLSEAELRKDLRLTPGRVYNEELVKRDVRELVRVYSPLGYIYVTGEASPDPDYLRIDRERLFQREAGKVELVYRISEGKPFKLGPILVKGNAKTQDKVILREIRTDPGQLYNSAELLRAQDRIRATGLFGAVNMTPITPPSPTPGAGAQELVEGAEKEPGTRALLVEVAETQTARFMVGAGVTSNSGLLGNLTYEQKNFDITNWPSTPSEFFSSRAFTGAGQTFRLQFEPGTELTRARVDFIEPWILDQPYSLGVSGYLSQRIRRAWDENRVGGRVSVGKRFSDVWSARIFMRGEDVEIDRIREEPLRAPEILEAEGHHTLTAVGLEVKRDTTDSPLLPSRGTITTLNWEHYGALGGDYDFDKFTAGWNWYQTIYEDLLDRRTILSIRTDVGYITPEAPFFERFYGGGIGSIRGFRYRGISPRSGVDEDPIGGDFLMTGTVELSFPIAAEVLRGVVFADAGTVEAEAEIGTIRTAVGFGFRLTLPFLGQLPIALDFGFPLSKDEQDETRLFSFSMGLVQ